jgi:hypothetical protein
MICQTVTGHHANNATTNGISSASVLEIRTRKLLEVKKNIIIIIQKLTLPHNLDIDAVLHEPQMK